MTSASHPANPRRDFAALALRSLSLLLLAAGIVALGYVAYAWVSARNFQALESRKFERAVAQPERSPDTRIVTEGEVIGKIEVPRLSLSAIVVQGDSEEVLRRAVGHVPETALPGQAGNIALAGHRDTIFRPLRDIRVGDRVTLKTVARDQTYQVVSTEVVSPTDMEVLHSRGENELTLITCFPFRYIGHAPDRFIVRARQVGE